MINKLIEDIFDDEYLVKGEMIVAIKKFIVTG
jgi:hypothetical protein